MPNHELSDLKPVDAWEVCCDDLQFGLTSFGIFTDKEDAFDTSKMVAMNAYEDSDIFVDRGKNYVLVKDADVKIELKPKTLYL